MQENNSAPQGPKVSGSPKGGRDFASLTPHEWVGVVLGALFLVPTVLVVLGGGAFADNTYGGTATSTGAITSPTTNTEYTGGSDIPIAGLLAPTYINALPSECGTGKVKVQWSSVTGALKYRLFRNSTLVYQGTGNYFVDSGLTPYTEYNYSVAALHTQGLSPLLSLSVLSPRKCTSAEDNYVADGTNPNYTNTASTTTAVGTDTYASTSTSGVVTTVPIITTAPPVTVGPAPAPVRPVSVAPPADTEESTQSNEEVPEEVEPSEGKSLERSLESAPLTDTPVGLPSLERERSEKLRVITALLESKEESDTSLVDATLYKDSNSDGISDYESEHVYGLAPDEPTPTSIYKGRRIGAAEKLLLGFDPAREELVSIVPEEPATSPVAPTLAYNVEEVALTSENKITLGGRALPNSFVTIYIYSTPVVVTVKTDTDGEWSYTLDKELEDGTHTVYTATVNNSGKILAKSSGYLFTKTAQAATLEAGVLEASPSPKPRLLDTGNIYLLLGALVAVLFIVFGVLGLSTKTNSSGTGVS